MLVDELISLSPLRLVTAKPNTYIREAAQRMARFGIGLLVVMDETDEIAGVLSERDIVAALGNSSTIVDYALVGDLMTSTVVSVTPEDTLLRAVQVMGSHGIRHVVAMDGNRPVGVLSIRDVLRVLAVELTENDGELDSQLTKELAKAMAA